MTTTYIRSLERVWLAVRSRFEIGGLIGMLIALSWLAACADLQAGVVVANLSGRVTQVTGNVPTGANIGDPVYLTASYDTTAPDILSDPTKTLQIFTTGGAYLQAIVQTSGGPLTFKSGPAGSGDPMYVYTFDQSGNSPGDYFEISANNSTGANWPAALFLNGYNQIVNGMLDQLPPYDMVDGVNTPASGLPDVSKVTQFAGEIRGSSSSTGGNYDIYWQFTATPEPTSFVTFLAVLGILFLRQREC